MHSNPLQDESPSKSSVGVDGGRDLWFDYSAGIGGGRGLRCNHAYVDSTSWFQRHCWYLVLCENTNFNFYTFSENEDIQNVKVYEVPNQGSGAGDRTIKITSKQNLSD